MYNHIVNIKSIKNKRLYNNNGVKKVVTFALNKEGCKIVLAKELNVSQKLPHYYIDLYTRVL